jgi:cytochrome bd-type quinol oxidase subunit 2
LNLFLFGVVFAPIAILLHESGHCGALAAIGTGPELHFASTTSARSIPPRAMPWVVAAGPAITAMMSFGGLLWLWYLRHGRLREPVKLGEWLATFCVLCALRWVRAIALQKPSDEANLSTTFGLPQQFLPYLFVVVALILLIAVLRMHPRGSLLPDAPNQAMQLTRESFRSG